MQFAARRFLANAAPLLEEERNACSGALALDGFNPLPPHWARPWAGFAAADHPMDAVKLKPLKRAR